MNTDSVFLRESQVYRGAQTYLQGVALYKIGRQELLRPFPASILFSFPLFLKHVLLFHVLKAKTL